jgi:hypothetical protein
MYSSCLHTSVVKQLLFPHSLLSILRLLILCDTDHLSVCFELENHLVQTVYLPLRNLQTSDRVKRVIFWGYSTTLSVMGRLHLEEKAVLLPEPSVLHLMSTR